MVHVDFFDQMMQGPPQHRLRARVVNEYSLALIVGIRSSILQERIITDISNGGGVSNSYRYRAETEGALAIGCQGTVALWLCRLPANKVTAAGVATHTVPAVRPLFDERFGKARRNQARNAAEVAFMEANRQDRFYLRVTIDPEFLGMIKCGTPTGVLCDWLQDVKDYSLPQYAQMSTMSLLEFLGNLR